MVAFNVRFTTSSVEYPSLVCHHVMSDASQCDPGFRCVAFARLFSRSDNALLKSCTSNSSVPTLWGYQTPVGSVISMIGRVLSSSSVGSLQFSVVIPLSYDSGNTICFLSWSRIRH